METRLNHDDRKALYSKIADALLMNFDEIIVTGFANNLDIQAYMDLRPGDFPVPVDSVCCDDNERDGLFVDEIIGEMSDDGKRVEGMLIGISRNYDDEEGNYRVDNVDIEDMDDDFLVRLMDYAIAHKGTGYDERNDM